MRPKWKEYICGAAVLLVALPIWARPKAERTDTATWNSSQSITIGNAQIKPGDYTFRAEESGKTLEVVRDGKVVAQVPCHWIELSKKADNTEISTDANKIVQIEFAGRTEAIRLGS